MHWPKLILLNGSSSAGKSTLAKLLQEKITEVPYIVFGFDTLIFLSPQRFWKDSATPEQSKNNPYLNEGVRMVHKELKGEPIKVEAEFGPTFNNIIASMPAVVRTLIDNGNYVIFDHVIHGKLMAEQYAKELHHVEQIKIAVKCSLEQLEARERARGDRVIGRARGLYDVVHQYLDYDIEVNTEIHSPEEVSDHIIEKIKSQ